MSIQLKSTIKKVMEEKLSPYDFAYNNAKSNSEQWFFSRQIDSVAELIRFDKSNHAPNSIRIFFQTTIDIPGIYGANFVENRNIWWTYQDADSLKNALVEMAQVAIEYGFPYFGFVRMPKPSPTQELCRFLIEQHLTLTCEFQKRYELDSNDPDSLQKVEEILKKNKKEKVEADWEVLLSASAYLGEVVRSTLGGIWTWNEQRQQPELQQINGKVERTLLPLGAVIQYWWNPFRSLQSVYKMKAN